MRGWLAQSERLPDARRRSNFHGPIGRRNPSFELFPLFTNAARQSRTRRNRKLGREAKGRDRGNRSSPLSLFGRWAKL
jgi:hypothetical protein